MGGAGILLSGNSWRQPMRIVTVVVGALALAGLVAIAFADDGLVHGNASTQGGRLRSAAGKPDR